MITKIPSLLLTATAVCFTGGMTANAAVIAGFDFSTLAGGTNNFGTSPLVSTTTAANTTNTGIVRGSGVGTTGTGAARGFGGNDFTGTSAATAVGLNEFFTVGVTAATGYSVSFSDLGAYNIRRSGTGPTTALWQYQIGAGTFTDIGTAFTIGANTAAAGNVQASVSLSGITALQTVAAGTTVTFRLVEWGASGTGGTFYLNDPVAGNTASDFTVNGSILTAVPEPQAASLLGALGVLGLIRRRR